MICADVVEKPGSLRDPCDRPRLGSVTTQMEIEMEPKRIAVVAALTAAMAAPAFAQAAPRSASTQHQLQQERMHRPARYHSAYRYEYHRGNEVGVIADDVTGANPFGAPPDGIFVAPFERGEIWWLKSR